MPYEQAATMATNIKPPTTRASHKSWRSVSFMLAILALCLLAPLQLLGQSWSQWVNPSELSVILFGCFVVSRGGIDRVREIADECWISIHVDACSPFAVFERHATETAGVVFALLGVLYVVCVSAQTQVGTAIVERVAVDVVYLLACLGIHQETVHLDWIAFSVRSSLGVKGLRGVIPMGVPVRSRKYGKVFRINFSELILGKGYEAVRWVRRQGNHRAPNSHGSGHLPTPIGICCSVVILCFLFAPSNAKAQAWSTFLDPSRALDWTSGVGFSIPNYTVNCATQLTGANALVSGSGAASGNTTKIQNAINSCDATHNVVNIPAGTWYHTGLYIQKSNLVLRGAGANSTFLIPTTGVGCGGGQQTGICALDPNDISWGPVVEPGGSQACSSWSSGYAQGTTTITLTGCGGTPPVGGVMVLLQKNDTTDTNGVYICDDTTSNCVLETPGANDGPIIGGVTYSEQQYTKVVSATSLGGGSYSVTISPGVYFTNVRSGQTPYALWFDTLTHVGYENFSIDGATMSAGHPTDFGNLGFYQCQQCWMKGVRSTSGGRYHVEPFLSFQTVIRDNYFFGALGSGSQSYAIEMENNSGALVENNIFQQVTAPIMVGGGNTGNVFSYNFSLNDVYTPATYAQAAYYSHNAGNNFNLFEGNNFVLGPWGDDVHGTTDQVTLFRNMSPGWYAGKIYSIAPFVARSKVRGVNIIGGVYGQAGVHTNYQSYATSSTGGTNASLENTVTVYSFGWLTAADQGCTVQAVTNGCDPLVFNSAMRWGNYDVVTAGVKWDSTEASPGAIPYLSANFSSGYFGSLAHTLPASLAYNSAPSWWPSGKAWPPIGPDISSGNVGTCSGGTYAGAQATASGQCTGGTLSTAWASHVTSIPAQDCYLTTMGGPPDGTGAALNFDASTCYTPPSSSYSLTVTATNGSVSGTNCTSGTYATGTTIGACTATPNTGYSFAGWSSSGSASCSGTGTCGPFSITTTTTITALMTANSYTLSTATAGTGSGTITGCAGPHTYTTAYSCTVTPAAGSSIASVTGCGGSGTSTYTGTMPASNCTVTATFQATAATPTFSPGAGSYGPAQTVTISTTTPGATLLYTTNGSTPACPSTGTTYTAPITVAVSETVKAIACASGYTDSAVGSAAYTINGAAAAPTFSPVAGTYATTQNVTLTSSTAGATIYYTTDGTTPTHSSSVYGSPVLVPSSLTIKAIAAKTGFSDSSVSSAAYVITSSGSPTISGSVTLSGTVGIQ